MRKFVAIIGFIIFCAILSACSFGIDFAIINLSDEIAEVEYVVKENANFLENPATKPHKISLSDWNKWFGKRNWSEVPRSEYEFNTETRKCRIKLNKNEVLRISSQNDSVVASENSDDFLIESLHLRGANGELSYQGNQFYKQFEKKSRSHYYIAYR